MMCRIVIVTCALLASANAANFLEDRTTVSEDTEISTTDENDVAEASDADGVESDVLEEDGAEDGDVAETQDDISSDEDQEAGDEGEDMDISDESAQEKDEGVAFLLQKPESTELPDDDETVALATDDSVEDEATEEDTEEASEETDQDDSDAASSSEETSNGDPSADESADSLQDPSSAESPVAETFAYDDSSTQSVNMVNVEGLADSDQASIRDEQAQLGDDQNADEVEADKQATSVDDELTEGDADQGSDAEDEMPLDDEPNDESENDLESGEAISLKKVGSVDAAVAKYNSESAKAKAQPPTNGTVQFGAQDRSSGFLKPPNATKLATLISTEVNEVASTENFLGEGVEAAFLAELTDGTAFKKEESRHDLEAGESISVKDIDPADAAVAKDNSESAKAKAQPPTNGTAQFGAQDGSSGFLKPPNATKLATLISTEVNEVASTENFLGEGAEAAFLDEVTDGTARKH